MRGVDKYQTGDVGGIKAGEDHDVRPAERMAHHDERRALARCSQRGSQVSLGGARIERSAARVAPQHPGAAIGAGASRGRDRVVHGGPGEGSQVVATRFEDDGRSPRASAIDLEVATGAQVDQLAHRRVAARGPVPHVLLVGRAEQHEEYE